MAWSAFYGMLAYAVSVTAVLGLFGIRVGRRFVTRHRRRSGRTTTPPCDAVAPPMSLQVFEGGQGMVDLVPERRAPPNLLEQEDRMEDILGRVLGSSMNTNPFYFR